MNRLKNLRGLLLVIALLVILYSLLPLGTALQFGGDEGLELCKGFMCSKGFALYTQIWNDQPPIFTLILSHAFKILGPSLLVARLIVVGFGLLFLGTFFRLVNQRLGQWPAFWAAFFLMASPVVFQISASVMLEVPAFAIALLSACFLFKWSKQPHWGWLLASGFIMGIALQTKLTAILFLPAMLVEIVLTRQPDRDRLWWKTAFVNLVQWGTAAAITFAMIGLFWARGSFQSSLKSHFSEHLVSGMGRPEDFPFDLSIVWNHFECVTAATVGVLIIAKRKRWRSFAFPIVLLLTGLTIHAVHRPWWSYYYLHLALPLAWLAGFAVSEAILIISQLLSASRFHVSSSKTWQGIALCALTALVLVRSERRLEATVEDMRQRLSVDADPVVAKMKVYADRTHWVYSQIEIYPFHARLPMPPELTVVVLKRFWSGQITVREIVETCKRYQTEQLLLKRGNIGKEWDGILKDYFVAYQNNDFVLYVTKRLEQNGKGVNGI